ANLLTTAFSLFVPCPFLPSICFVSAPSLFYFFFTAPTTSKIYTLSLHDALPILFVIVAPLPTYHCPLVQVVSALSCRCRTLSVRLAEFTSEVQLRVDVTAGESPLNIPTDQVVAPFTVRLPEPAIVPPVKLSEGTL